jgi:hypothetical protein
MFAAHALILNGFQVTIFSKKRISQMFGAQYLHRPIPGLVGSDQPEQILYELWGTDQQYEEKVYGVTGNVPFVSPSRLRGVHPGWDIRRAYYDAYARYADSIVNDPSIDGDRIAEDMKSGYFGLVVSTIPAPDICINPIHQFKIKEVWAVGDAPDKGITCPVTIAPNTVICNGTESPAWYRASNVFGFKTAEWPEDHRPPVRDIALIRKPIESTCNCWVEDGVVKLGRFGTWDKGAYSHDAYYTLQEIIG